MIEKNRTMKLAIKLILVLCLSVKAFSQEPDIHVSTDVFLNIYYNKGQIVPPAKGTKVLNHVAEGIITNKIPDKYNFRIEVGTCEYEKKNDVFVSYKRLEYLFNYFEQQYNVDRGKFQFDFSDSESCYVEQEDNISFVNFALQNCQSFKKSDLEILDNLFENIFYARNSIIPKAKGKKLIQNIGTAIKNNKILDKYSIAVQVCISNKEKEYNPFIAYERIEYLLNYLAKEFEIKKEKIKFEFISNKEENGASFIRFVLLNCN